CLGVEADVDLLVGDAVLVQRLVGGVALHAGRLGVNGDAHRGTTPLSDGGNQTRLATTRLLHMYCYSASRRAAEFPSSRTASTGARCRLVRPDRPGKPGV